MFRHNEPMEPERTVVAPPRQVARLKATLEDGMQTFLPLTSTATTMTIGRDPSCGWYLQDLSVSRIHASIRWSGVALAIEDHGSSGGTFVAGRQVGTTPCLVRPGDPVRVGDALFVLELVSGIASADLEQTRMVSSPRSPLSGAVTPAPSRNQKPVELALGTSADDERTAFSAVAAPHAEPQHARASTRDRSRASAREDDERTAFSTVATPARGNRATAPPPSMGAAGDDEKTAFTVEMPHAAGNVVVDATAQEVELPVVESRPQRLALVPKLAAKSAPAVKPAPPATPKPAPPPAVKPVPPATPKPAPVATRPTTPPKAIPAVKPAPPVAAAVEQHTTEAEIPMPAAPWSVPKPPAGAQTKTAAELPLPAARAPQPRTESQVRLPPASARTATKTMPEHQLPTEAQIQLPEAKAARALPPTETELRLADLAAARAQGTGTIPVALLGLPARAPDHAPLVYVPDADVLAPTEVTRSWAVEAALAKPREGLFGVRRGAVKSGMPVQKSPESKSAIGKLAQLAKSVKAKAASAKSKTTPGKTAKPSKAESTAKTSTLSSQRRRILLLAGPALLAIVTSASAWMQSPEPAPAAEGKTAKHAKAHAANGAASNGAASNGAASSGVASSGAGAASGGAASGATTSGAGAAQQAVDPAQGAPGAVAAPASSAQHDELLAGAIRAYSDGNRAQALSMFRQLGPNDATGRAMVHIITLQTGEGR